jgi:hypothetical protein
MMKRKKTSPQTTSVEELIQNVRRDPELRKNLSVADVVATDYAPRAYDELMQIAIDKRIDGLIQFVTERMNPDLLGRWEDLYEKKVGTFELAKTSSGVTPIADEQRGWRVRFTRDVEDSKGKSIPAGTQGFFMKTASTDQGYAFLESRSGQSIREARDSGGTENVEFALQSDALDAIQYSTLGQIEPKDFTEELKNLVLW